VRMATLLAVMISAACLQAQTSVDRSWKILSDGAQDNSYEKRTKVMHALAFIPGDVKAQATAETALKDSHEEVRAAAAEALGGMGAKGSAPKLRTAINDQATSAVFAAANTLFVIGDRTLTASTMRSSPARKRPAIRLSTHR
jgi:HEAT repeat protein